MSYMSTTRRGIALCTLMVLGGCASDQTNSPPPPAPPPPPPPPAEHRIGVRPAGGTPEFYDRVTNAKFTPRGNNYTRLNTMDRILGGTTFYHSTFNPTYYDSTRSERTLADMETLKYNVVRVYLDGM